VRDGTETKSKCGIPQY